MYVYTNWYLRMLVVGVSSCFSLPFSLLQWGLTNGLDQWVVPVHCAESDRRLARRESSCRRRWASSAQGACGRTPRAPSQPSSRRPPGKERSGGNRGKIGERLEPIREIDVACCMLHASCWLEMTNYAGLTGICRPNVTL